MTDWRERLTDDRKAIDVAAALQAQAESAQQTAEELRALSVNVMNLVELVRVLRKALREISDSDHDESSGRLRDIANYALEVAGNDN